MNNYLLFSIKSYKLLADFVKNKTFDMNTENDVDFLALVEPIKEHISIAEMIEAQNYQQTDKDSFFEEAAKIEITESIEELLEMLTK